MTATGGTTTSLVEAAVREYYSGGVADLNYNFTEPSMIKKIERGKAEELNTRAASLVIRPLNNESERWSTTEYADYPAPGNSPLVKTTVPFVGVSATVMFSDQVFEENMNATTIADLVQGEIDNKLEALSQSREFFVWGDGSGEIARVSAFNSGTGVVTLNNSGNLYGAQMIGVGRFVEFRTSGGTLRSGGGPVYGKVSAKDNGALTITLDATVGFPNDIANGDRVYIQGSYAGAPRGFLYHITNSGAWQGLSDRTIYTGTNPPIQNASSAVLSAGLMDKMISGVAFKRRSRKIGNFRFYASTQYDAYLATGYELKTFQNTTDLKGGFTSMTHAGVPIDWHPFAQRDMLWALDASYMRFYSFSGKITWVKNEAGGIFFRLNASQGQLHAAGKAAYIDGRYNYGTKEPVKLGTRIYSLATTNLEAGNDT